MNRISATLIFILCVNSFSVSVFAWCDNYPDIQTDFSQNDLVFIGKVISEEKVHGKDEFFDGIYYEIKVTEAFKGKPMSPVTVFSENSSGRFSMEVGQDYLVFTSVQPQEYVNDSYAISNCGNSGKISEKQTALLTLKKLLCK